MIHQLYIPNLGDMLKVDSEWDFILYPDSSNEKMGAYYGYSFFISENGFCWCSKANLTDFKPFLPLSIPVGTILRVDRIDARKNTASPPSITFTAIMLKTKKKTKFSVSLAEANKLTFSEVYSEYIG